MNENQFVAVSGAPPNCADESTPHTHTVPSVLSMSPCSAPHEMIDLGGSLVMTPPLTNSVIAGSEMIKNRGRSTLENFLSIENPSLLGDNGPVYRVLNG